VVGQVFPLQEVTVGNIVERTRSSFTEQRWTAVWQFLGVFGTKFSSAGSAYKSSFGFRKKCAKESGQVHGALSLTFREGSSAGFHLVDTQSRCNLHLPSTHQPRQLLRMAFSLQLLLRPFAQHPTATIESQATTRRLPRLHLFEASCFSSQANALTSCTLTCSILEKSRAHTTSQGKLQISFSTSLLGRSIFACLSTASAGWPAQSSLTHWPRCSQ